MALTHSIRLEEYETQLYTFSCQDFFEYVKGVILQAIQSEFQELQPLLLNRQKTEEGRTAVVNSTSAANEKCFVLSEKPLNVFSSMMNSFFCLPAHVLLPEDEVQRRVYTEQDEEIEKKSLIKLQARLRRARYLEAAYEEEIRMLQQVEERMKLFSEICSKVDSVGQIGTLPNKLHQLIQNLLGLEVSRASLKLAEHSWSARLTLIESYNRKK